MTFHWIDSRDPRYLDWLALRQRILREPLGLSFSPEDLEAEQDQFHLLAMENGETVGGLIAVPLEHTTWKIRQVAVAEDRQGSGLGRRLMLEAEQEALKKGIEQLTLNARETVILFYEKLGYAAVGERFIEVGIPHQKMVRKLETVAE